jgi:ABC-type arginine/histidine transport system permease subunit
MLTGGARVLVTRPALLVLLGTHLSNSIAMRSHSTYYTTLLVDACPLVVQRFILYYT